LVELVENGRMKISKALDIGCGTGTNVLYLAKKGFEVYGVDISKVAIRKATAKARERGLKCNFRVLNFTEPQAVSKAFSTFDILLDLGCLHSLSSRDRDGYADSLRVVSHTGSLYLLWCFLRGPRWSCGPPGVDEQEVESRFSNQFLIIEKRRLSSFREMLFYVMERN